MEPCVDQAEAGFDQYLTHSNGNPLVYDTVKMSLRRLPKLHFPSLTPVRDSACDEDCPVMMISFHRHDDEGALSTRVRLGRRSGEV